MLAISLLPLCRDTKRARNRCWVNAPREHPDNRHRHRWLAGGGSTDGRGSPPLCFSCCSPSAWRTVGCLNNVCRFISEFPTHSCPVQIWIHTVVQSTLLEAFSVYYCQKQDVRKCGWCCRKSWKGDGRKLEFSRNQTSIGNLMGNDSLEQYLHTNTKCSSGSEIKDLFKNKQTKNNLGKFYGSIKTATIKLILLLDYKWQICKYQGRYLA